MAELYIFPWLLSLFLFFVALADSSVGLDGGSTDTALPALRGVGHAAIPTITLSLNLVVSSIGA